MDGMLTLARKMLPSTYMDGTYKLISIDKVVCVGLDTPGEVGVLPESSLGPTTSCREKTFLESSTCRQKRKRAVPK